MCNVGGDPLATETYGHESMPHGQVIGLPDRPVKLAKEAYLQDRIRRARDMECKSLQNLQEKSNILPYNVKDQR